MTKKIILFVLIIACLAGLVMFSFWQEAPPPPSLPSGGPGGPESGPGGDRGAAAPDFTLPTVQGKKVSLSEFKGKVVVINFWSSHCPPCILEMPSFQKLNQAMKGKPFQLLAVTTDSREVAEDVMQKLNVDFTVLIDQDGDALYKYAVTVSPETFIIAPDGTVNNHLTGAANWSDPSVIDYLDQLIKAAPKPAPAGG